MVELEYNGERYMVDGGKWYRRLNEREVRPPEYEYLSDVRIPKEWYKGEPYLVGVALEDEANPDDYRVPCVDPRPPFKVGDMVKVARKDEGWAWWESCMEVYIGVETPVISVDRDGDVEIDIEHEGEWVFPPWCLDLIKPAHPQPKETAMKFTQWQLRPVTEPKTLADVSSSRESPVLCWIGQASICLMFIDGTRAMRKLKDGMATECMEHPSKYTLYQPSTPAYTLGTLPDYRVVVDEAVKGGEKYWWFRLNGKWYWHGGESDDLFSISLSAKPSTDFIVTPYEAYLAEVELTGGAK